VTGPGTLRAAVPPGARLALSAYPCRLPHVVLEQGQLFFGGLLDPEAGAAECRFLALADGKTPFAAILTAEPSAMGAAAASRHAVWLAQPLDRLAPAAAARAGGGPRCLLVGAHPGDVALSMGGLVLVRGKQARFTELCCFSRQIETRVPRAFASQVAVTAVRRDESHLAAAVLGIDTRHLDLPEYVLRQTADARDRMLLAPPEFEAAVRIALHDAIVELAPDQVFAPAAAGNHPDQRLIFDAIVELFERGDFPGTSYHLYENVPLAVAHLHVDDFLARFEGSYLEACAWYEEITEVLPQKLSLLEIFRSRLDLSFRPLLAAVARRDALLADLPPGSAAERFWTLREAAIYR
jgi:LmbE family N-acetylglucosaminyl deacetylase